MLLISGVGGNSQLNIKTLTMGLPEVTAIIRAVYISVAFLGR